MTQPPIGQPFPHVLSPFPNRQPVAADLRNKLIAKIFFDMGIIEQYGRGITKIKEECEKNSNSYPEWDNRLGTFTTVYKRRGKEAVQGEKKSVKMLSPLQRQILLYLRQNPSASRRQIKSELPKTTDNIIKYNLAQLQKMGLLKHNGANHGGEWIVFIDN